MAFGGRPSGQKFTGTISSIAAPKGSTLMGQLAQPQGGTGTSMLSLSSLLAPTGAVTLKQATSAVGSSTSPSVATKAGNMTSIGIDTKFSGRQPTPTGAISQIKQLGAADRRFKFADIRGRKERKGKQRIKDLG